MYEEKRVKIFLIKVGTKWKSRMLEFRTCFGAGNAVYSNAMNKFSNEKQGNFKLFNLCNRFFKRFYKL